MKYAAEVIEYMEFHRGEDVRMASVVQYISPTASVKAKHNIRRAILRVFVELAGMGIVLRSPPRASGGYVTYRWKSAT